MLMHYISDFIYLFGFRIEKAKKFVKAISRPTRSDLAPIRVKEPVRFEQVETIFPRFVCCTLLCCACTPRVKKTRHHTHVDNLVK